MSNEAVRKAIRSWGEGPCDDLEDLERRVLSCLSTPAASGAGPVGEAVAYRWRIRGNDGWVLTDEVPVLHAPETIEVEFLYTRPVEEPDEVERLTRERDEALTGWETANAKRIASERDRIAAEAEIERWCENSRANWEAFSAMRNDINELVGNMASSEAALINGPEMQHQCEAVATSVRDKLERQERLLREASNDAGNWEDYCRAAEAALAETRERLEEIEGLVFLADQALMELHGRFPLDEVTNEDRRLKQACKALRAVTGPNHETRNIRADQVRAALTGGAQEG